jgi:hypothetical protein
MKAQYKITRISEGVVYAKEVNPLAEPQKLTLLATKWVTTFEFDKWQEAEVSLQEFRISEHPKETIGLIYIREPDTGKSFHEWLIGQIISAELINGELHI